jgi:retron-type reverse transcriptase
MPPGSRWSWWQDCSTGRNDKLIIKLQFGRYGRVVEADIKGFFDNIDHDRLLKMLEHALLTRRC